VSAACLSTPDVKLYINCLCTLTEEAFGELHLAIFYAALIEAEGFQCAIHHNAYVLIHACAGNEGITAHYTHHSCLPAYQVSMSSFSLLGCADAVVAKTVVHMTTCGIHTIRMYVPHYSKQASCSWCMHYCMNHTGDSQRHQVGSASATTFMSSSHFPHTV